MVKPRLLVYSCSGCSSAAQMANQMALWLDREGLAEMSCIAGVGGGVVGLQKIAQSGRPILALDGCRLHCVSACLQQAGVAADSHITLGDYGVRKKHHTDFERHQAHTLYDTIVMPAVRALQRSSAPVPRTD